VPFVLYDDRCAMSTASGKIIDGEVVQPHTASQRAEARIFGFFSTSSCNKSLSTNYLAASDRVAVRRAGTKRA
jgi:hypothetical protein